MPRNDKARVEALGRAALAYCAAHPEIAHPVPRVHCAAFAAAEGCTVETARRHLVFAVAYRERGVSAVPPGWGGVRPGAGRKPKTKETVMKAYIKWHGRKNGQEQRAELRAGEKGTGKVLQVVNYWPESSTSRSAAADIFEQVARREGYKIVGSDRDEA